VIWYCDSSALVKRYVREAGSRWFREQHSKHKLLTSELAIVEVAAAFARRRREGTISLFEFHRDRTQFARHIHLGQYTLLPSHFDIIERAARLAYQRPLTAYDAVHLATALIYARALSAFDVPQFQFITADQQLKRAVESEGLQVENPNDH